MEKVMPNVGSATVESVSGTSPKTVKASDKNAFSKLVNKSKSKTQAKVNQKNADQITMPFASGSVWVCFSDQASHAVMSGQYMLEQTFHLPVEQQYHPELSPLHILQRLTGKGLI